MKKPLWYPKLTQFVIDNMAVPSVFGQSDCLITLSEAVEIQTGIDHASPFRGQYQTLAEGYSLLRRHGYENPMHLVSTKFKELVGDDGQPTTALIFDGDIGAIPVGDDWSFGVVIGAIFYPKTATGLGVLPRRAVKRAFRVE